MSEEREDFGSKFTIPVGEIRDVQGGPTLRDWFAAHALVIASGYNARGQKDHIAALAYEIADAMIKAREVQS